ncbi:MAG: hypothetical protein L0Z62_19090, partial [Gemmataceae bacterium]|nr:hypothetical protein [Gemmataceae bacterium]
MPPANLGQLLESQDLQTLLHHFTQGWDEDRLAEFAGKLPPTGPFRRLALAELIKLDLRLHWQRGTRRSLESYLFSYPELGLMEALPPDLVRAELEARQQAGDQNAWQELTLRFPGQCAQLQRDFTEPGLQGVTDPYGPTLAPDTSPDAIARTSPPTAPTTPEMSSDNPSAGPPPQLQVGRYNILKELGRGAMGTVYLAEDPSLQRRVALKIPHFQQGDNPDLLERFYREARSAATLDHPNICPVYDVGQHGGRPYLTMAFIEG